MTMKEQPKLGNNTTDIVAAISKVGVGMVPYVGSILGEIIGNVIPNQRIDRITQFVQHLDERLVAMEQETLRTRMMLPLTVDLLEDAFTQASRATSNDRIEQVANVVAHGISAETMDQVETKRMLWLLGQLNDIEVILLRNGLVRMNQEYQLDSEFQKKHAKILAPRAPHMNSSEDEIEEAALFNSYRQHLADLGLLRGRFKQAKKGELPEFDEKTGMLKASGYDVTRLGLMLLRHLGLIPSWYR